MAENNTKRTHGRLKIPELGALPVIALVGIAQAIQYYIAFGLIHDGLSEVLKIIGGAAAGLGLVWSVSYVSNKLVGTIGKEANRNARAFMTLILILSPVVLTLAHIPEVWTWQSVGRLLSVAIMSTLPELALAAASFVDRSLHAVKPAQSQSPATAKPRKAEPKKVACPHCRRLLSQSGLNAHVAYCKDNPERRSKFSIPVDLARS